MLVHPRIHRWRDRPGILDLAIYGDWHGNRYRWFTAADDRPLCDELAAIVLPILDRIAPLATEATIRVHFRSSGYYDPGRRLGSYDAWTEPQGEDVRTCDGVEIVAEGKTDALNPLLAAVVWSVCEDAVAEAKVDYEQD